VRWFVLRAGVARFTTFAAAAGLAISAFAEARPAVAVCALAAALLVIIASAGRRHHVEARGGGAAIAACRVLVVGIVLVGLCAGYLAGTVRVAALVASKLESHIGQSLTAELVVTGTVRSSDGWLRATAKLVGLPGTPAGAPTGNSALGETVLLEVPPGRDGAANPAADLTQGAIMSFQGTVEAPRGPSASGFDQARQLLHQGIKVVLRGESVVVIGRRGGVAGWFDRLRASAREHLSRGPDARVDEVVQGVVVGDTAGIDEGWLDAFRRAGTAHMLSVSGLHVASLAAIMIGLARLLRAPRWVGFLLAAAAAVLIVPFVGSSPPVVRSAVMIVIVLSGRWVGRGRDQWQVLALAALVVLGLNPFAVFDVGFQLSFAAFIGMLVLLVPLQRLLKSLPGSIGSNVAVSLAASAGTAPVALATFGKTSLVSPFANLLVVPTLPLITGLGMASVFLGFVWGGFSVALDTLTALPMMWTVLVSKLMALAPVLGTGDLGRAAAAVAAGAAAVPVSLALLGLRIRLPLGVRLPLFASFSRWVRVRRPRSRRLAFSLAVVIVGVGAVAGVAAYPVVASGADTIRVAVGGRGWPAEVELRVLDVGQGNAVLLRTPQHHAALFDGGPAGCDLARQLHSLGVDDLDLVVISHPHADHFAGLLEALDEVEVGTLVDAVQVMPEQQTGARAGPGGAPAESEAAAYLELRRRITEQGGGYVFVSDGCSLRLDDVAVRFLAPAKPLVLYDQSSPWGLGRSAPSGDELNGASLVAVVSAGTVDMLLPGDAEASVLQRYDLPPTELLVVSHHGSWGAVTRELLARWGTQAALISVGKDNSFGHPDPDTLTILHEAVRYVVRTDRSGWVCCSVKGDGMAITAERTATNDATGAE